MINPYSSYFGLNNIWLRGFRLNNINKDHNNIHNLCFLFKLLMIYFDYFYCFLH